jgi:hypothetical protein
LIGGRNADPLFSRLSLGRVLASVLAPVAPFWRFGTPATIGRIAPMDSPSTPDIACCASLSLFPSDFCNPSDERESLRMP